MSFSPSLRLSSLQRGGKIELTVTRFAFSIPASRSASSKDEKTILMNAMAVRKKDRLRNEQLVCWGISTAHNAGNALSLFDDLFFAAMVPRLVPVDASATKPPPRDLVRAA